MSQNKMTFSLLLTACFRVMAVGEEVLPAPQLVYSYDWAHSLDRGFFSKPIKVSKLKSLYTSMDELVRKSYDELSCSYAFSVLLHMYLTKAFIVNPSHLLGLTISDVNCIVFNEEAAAILAIVHDHFGEDRKDMVELMWIFLLYTEKMSSFVREQAFKSQSHSGGSVLSTYEIVRELFEVFVEINSCVAYDPDSHQPTDIRQTSTFKNAMSEGATTLRLAANDSKIWFLQQTEHNVKLGLNLAGSNRFSGNSLLMNYPLDDKKIVNSLKVAFGPQLNWELIMGEIGYNYILSKNVIVHLHVRIKALVAFQKDFIDLLKAIIIRIAIRHMLYIKDIINKTSYLSIGAFMLRNCGYYNAKMAEYVTEFSKYFHLTDDPYLRPVIELMMKPTRNFFTNSRIDGCISSMFESLEKISSGGKQFAKPIEVNEDKRILTIKEVIKVAKANSINLSDEDNQYAIRESLLSAEVFVGYAKKITTEIDLKAIKSFVQIEASDNYNRLKDLENINLDNLEQLVNLKF